MWSVERRARQVRAIIEVENIKCAAQAKINPDKLALTAQQKLDAAIKQAKRELDLEFEQRIQEEIRHRLEATILPHYKKTYDEYVRVIKARKGVMDRASYRKILAALHPNRVQDPVLKKRAEEAFNTFTKIERLLLDEKQSPTATEPMPRSYADLIEQFVIARKQRLHKQGHKMKLALE
jgi:ribosomal protein L17